MLEVRKNWLGKCATCIWLWSTVRGGLADLGQEIRFDFEV